MQIEQRKVSDLLPYVNNARTHSAGQIAQVAASIKEFGFNNPILVDGDRTIIAGHARLAAARKLDLETVPCVEISHLSDAQRRAYILADNRLAEHAGWDDELLRAELQDLQALGVDCELIGFDDSFFVLTQGLTDEDEAPELADAAVTVPGDLWELGGHRLLCRDCTDADDVAKVLAGETPRLMVTDPPYGVRYDPDWRNRADRANGKPYGARAVGQVTNDDRADWREAWSLFPGSVAYVWHGGTKAGIVAASLEACGFVIRSQIVWIKTRHVLSRGHYHVQHEPCWYAVEEGADDGWRFLEDHEAAAYAVKKGDTANWHGGRKQSTAWFIEHLKSDTGHGTQKPVEAMRRPIRNNSARGDAVYDPFVGSGTTIIAAQTTERRCLAMEIDPHYCDVVIRRWQDFIGAEAMLEGKSFEQVARERGGR